MCWYIFILFADTYFWHVHLIKIHRLGKVGHLVQGVTLSKILPVIFHIHIFFSVAPVISLSISPSLFHSLVYFFIFMVSSPFTSISLTLLCSQQIQQNDSLSSFFFCPFSTLLVLFPLLLVYLLCCVHVFFFHPTLSTCFFSPDRLQ